MSNPWVQLFIAGLLEVAWAIGLKYSDGFSRWQPSVLTVLFMVASFYFLAQAIKQIPVGTSYAVWTGIGTIGTSILGIVLFSEPATMVRLLCILMIVTGIIGLKLTASGGF